MITLSLNLIESLKSHPERYKQLLGFAMSYTDHSLLQGGSYQLEFSGDRISNKSDQNTVFIGCKHGNKVFTKNDKPYHYVDLETFELNIKSGRL